MVTTNLPDGVTNTLSSTVFGAYGAPDPSRYYSFFEDFNRYNAAAAAAAGVDWVSTVTGTPTATIANEAGGVLHVATSATAGDVYAAQWSGSQAAVIEPFAFTPGKQAWFKTRVKLDNANLSSFQIGLMITDTTPLDATDGVWFICVAGTPNTTLNAAIGGTKSTVNVGTLPDNTYSTLGFYYDGASTLIGFLNDLAAVSMPATNLTAHTLTPTFRMANGSAAARTLSLDYLHASFER